MKKIFETQVLIIGGGVTGTGIARDLSLRGFNCILIEKQDLNVGASGGNHGLLHSGARYICSNPEAAVECNTELNTIKRTARHCVEETGGLFVAVNGDDEKYIADFPHMCDSVGIPCQPIDVKDALEMEPVISKDAIAVYGVNDSSINPFKLSIENMNEAVIGNHICPSGFTRQYFPHSRRSRSYYHTGRTDDTGSKNMPVCQDIFRCLAPGQHRR